MAMEKVPKWMTKMIKDIEQLLYEKHLKHKCHGAREKGLSPSVQLEGST